MYLSRTLQLSRISLLACLIAGGAAAQDWPHAAGDMNASGNLNASGAVTGAVEELPGVVWAVPLGETAFAPQRLHDVDDNGTYEAILPFQQRLAAFELDTGTLIWASSQIGVSHILEPFDPFCQGGDTHFLVLDAEMGGGVHAVDIKSGAVSWSFKGLEAASGVHPAEITTVDFDDDGCDELVFSAFLSGDPTVYAADLSTVDGVPRVTTGTLTGSYLQVVRSTAGDFDDDGVSNEILFHQRDYIDFKEICGPADGGTCDDVDGTLCLCDLQRFDGLYSPGAFPQPYTVNPGDAGADEVLMVHDHPTFDRGIGLLEPATALASGDGADLDAWYYDYGADTTRPLEHGAPTDLDGDGVAELLVTLFDAGTGEVDWDGNAVDDGVANPGAFSLAAYDVGTGALLASVDDRYGLGRADLDGDGIDEVVTQVTSGWTFSGGSLEAFRLDCTGGTCAWTSVWTGAYEAIRFPQLYDGVGFPPRSVAVSGTAGGAALLAYDGADLVTLQYDGVAGLTELGRVTLAEEDSVLIASEEAQRVALGLADGSVSVRSGALVEVTSPYRPPSQAAARMHSVFLSDADTRATPIVDGLIFVSNMEPSDAADADFDLEGTLLFARDLDGDGLAELISFEQDIATGGFHLRCHSYLGTGAFALQWEFDSLTDPGLAGHGMETLWTVGSYDYTGDGVDEVLVHFSAGNPGKLMSFDGASGAVDWSVVTNARRSYYTPLIPADIAAPGSFGTQDGTVDVLRPTIRRVTGWRYGSSAVAGEILTSDFNSQWSAGDLDGDGDIELVSALTGRINRAQVEAWEVDPTVAPAWGPVTSLGAPPEVEQGMALADLDTRPGLDVVFASSEGRLDVASGDDGGLLSGFPIYLGGGVLSTQPVAPREPLTAVIAGDIDGDGNDEIIAGSRAGYVYAVNAADAEGSPSLEWTIFVGAPVVRLSGGDVDGDGEVELLVSAADGLARAIDGIGANLEILAPLPEDCITGTTVEVSGTSTAVDTVQVLVQGVLMGTATPDSAGDWSVSVAFPLVDGLVEITAVGVRGGVPTVTNSVQLYPGEGDLDGDGITVCGGDCDDGDDTIYPGSPELCDGIDNDCDVETDENADDDGDGFGLCDDPADCDDTLADVNPDADEICDDGLDNDCDGAADSADDDCDSEPTPGDDDDDVTDPEGCAGCGDCGSNQSGGGAGLFGLLIAGLLVRRRVVVR